MTLATLPVSISVCPREDGIGTEVWVSLPLERVESFDTASSGCFAVFTEDEQLLRSIQSHGFYLGIETRHVRSIPELEGVSATAIIAVINQQLIFKMHSTNAI